MQQLYYTSLIIIYILLVVATILSIIRYKRTSQNEKWYIYYIIFVFFIELFSLILPLSYFVKYTKITNNAFLYPIYLAGEFFIVSGIFIKKLNLNTYLFIVTALISLFFLVADRILISYEYNNDYSKGISNIIMISLIGYSLIQDIKTIKNKSPFQIIDKMYFLYFTVSIFIFMFQHQLIAFPTEYFASIWLINNIMSTVIYLIFIKVFLSLKK